jgi:hypothetical protein
MDPRGDVRGVVLGASRRRVHLEPGLRGRVRGRRRGDRVGLAPGHGGRRPAARRGRPGSSTVLPARGRRPADLRCVGLRARSGSRPWLRGRARRRCPCGRDRDRGRRDPVDGGRSGRASGRHVTRRVPPARRAPGEPDSQLSGSIPTEAPAARPHPADRPLRPRVDALPRLRSTLPACVGGGHDRRRADRARHRLVSARTDHDVRVRVPDPGGSRRDLAVGPAAIPEVAGDPRGRRRRGVARIPVVGRLGSTADLRVAGRDHRPRHRGPDRHHAPPEHEARLRRERHRSDGVVLGHPRGERDPGDPSTRSRGGCLRLRGRRRRPSRGTTHGSRRRGVRRVVANAFLRDPARPRGDLRRPGPEQGAGGADRPGAPQMERGRNLERAGAGSARGASRRDGAVVPRRDRPCNHRGAGTAVGRGPGLVVVDVRRARRGRGRRPRLRGRVPRARRADRRAVRRVDLGLVGPDDHLSRGWRVRVHPPRTRAEASPGSDGGSRPATTREGRSRQG